MDLAGFKAFIEKQDWIFAKTYADKAPHEYVVRGRINGTDEEFMEAREFVRQNGFKMYWLDLYPNKYIHLDGYNYWFIMLGENDPHGCFNRSVADEYRISCEWKVGRKRRLLEARRKRKEEEKRNGSDLQGN